MRNQALLSLNAENPHVREARRFTHAVLGHWHLCDAVQDSAVLVVGELTANAARHGGADMTLSLDLCDGILSIAVRDSGAAFPPVAGDASVSGERGRGLHIVRALANRAAICWDERGTLAQAELCAA